MCNRVVTSEKSAEPSGIRRICPTCFLEVVIKFIYIFYNTRASSKAYGKSQGCLKRQRNQRSNRQHLLDHRESKGIPEKHLFLLH